MILFLHNRYRTTGGEERVVADQQRLVREELGEDAELLERDSAVLGRSRARVVLIAPGDAFGDRRQPNLPGTIDSYPNWRLPVVDGDGERVTVERLITDPRPRRLAEVIGARGAGRVRGTTPRRP